MLAILAKKVHELFAKLCPRNKPQEADIVVTRHGQRLGKKRRDPFAVEGRARGRMAGLLYGEKGVPRRLQRVVRRGGLGIKRIGSGLIQSCLTVQKGQLQEFPRIFDGKKASSRKSTITALATLSAASQAGDKARKEAILMTTCDHSLVQRNVSSI